MEFQLITTDRLILRIVTQEVYNFVYLNYSTEKIMLFFGYQSETEYQKEKAKYEKGLTSVYSTITHFQMIDKQSEEIIGGCGFHNWPQDHNRAELGYSLTAESNMGKGLMTEALAPTIESGFMQMNLHRIEAFVGPNNCASLSIMRKFKFLQEGHMKEHYLRDGVFEDSLIFALLVGDYGK